MHRSSEMFAILSIWRILSPYWRAPVKLLPKETSLSKRAGHSTSLVLPCPGVGLAPNVSREEEGFVPPVLSSHPTNPKSVPSLQDYLLDRGVVSYYPEVLPRQEPTPWNYIHMTFNECLMSLKKSTHALKTLYSQLNKWPGAGWNMAAVSKTGLEAWGPACLFPMFFWTCSLQDLVFRVPWNCRIAVDVRANPTADSQHLLRLEIFSN